MPSRLVLVEPAVVRPAVGRWAAVGLLTAIAAVAGGAPVGAEPAPAASQPEEAVTKPEPMAEMDQPDPGAPWAEVTTEPAVVVPYEPVTFQVAGTGCGPGAPVTVEVSRVSVLGDMVTLAPRRVLVADADGDGSWVASLAFPTAYPGSWMVDPGCGTTGANVDVPLPSDHRFEVSPATLRAGQSVTVEIQGTGCRGESVQWELGRVPESHAGGRVPVAADGSWRDSATFRTPTETGPLPVHVFCRFPAGAGGDVDADEVSVAYDLGEVTVERAPTEPDGAGGWARELWRRLLCRFRGC